jgi:hypothetical protein
MGAGNAGASGSDAGFTNSVQTREKKANEKNLGTSDYQGDLNSKNKNKNNNNNNNNGGGNDGNNTIAQVTATAPTTAEVSQATTTEAVADTEANRLLKIKKKGRSQSIMTSSKGVTKTSADYSLGKSSLLGKV